MSRGKGKKVSKPTPISVGTDQPSLFQEDARDKATLDLIETVLTQPDLTRRQRLDLVNALTKAQPTT